MINAVPDQRADSLPSGWLWKPFGEVVTHSQNGVSKRRSTNGAPTPVLRLADIREGEVDESSPREIKLSDQELSKYALRDGDLLCVRVNGSRSLTGRLVYFRSRKVWAYCDHFIRFHVKSEVADSKYLAHYFNTEAVRRYLGKHMVSTAGQNTVSQGTMLGVAVPFAPVNQQRDIVAEIEKQFSRLDEAVANLKRVRANLKRYKAAVLKAAVEGKLTEDWRKQHPDVEPASKLLERILAERRAKWNGRGKYKEPAKPEAGTLPLLSNSWIWTVFEQISIRVTVGHVGPMKHEYVSKGIPFLRSQNIRENKFDPEGLLFISPDFHSKLSKSVIRSGDLAVVRSGSVGVTCVIPDTLGEANCADLVLIQGPLGLVPQFGAYYMNSMAKRHIEAGKVGIALTHFNTRSVAALPVPLPPLAEQERIVSEVERRLSVIEELEAAVRANLTRADRLRQSILSQAFSGRFNS